MTLWANCHLVMLYSHWTHQLKSFNQVIHNGINIVLNLILLSCSKLAICLRVICQPSNFHLELDNFTLCYPDFIYFYVLKQQVTEFGIIRYMFGLLRVCSVVILWSGLSLLLINSCTPFHNLIYCPPGSISKWFVSMFNN